MQQESPKRLFQNPVYKLETIQHEPIDHDHQNLEFNPI